MTKRNKSLPRIFKKGGSWKVQQTFDMNSSFVFLAMMFVDELNVDLWFVDEPLAGERPRYKFYY